MDKRTRLKKLILIITLTLFVNTNNIRIFVLATDRWLLENKVEIIEEPKEIKMIATLNYLQIEPKISFEEANEKLSDIIKQQEEKTNTDAWSVARSLKGRKGNCYRIAQLFINKFKGKGHPIKYNYEVTKEEVRAGDLIYYKNGGLGIEHWAIYLTNGAALHGNFNGRAVIDKVYLEGASNPIFYRVK